MKNLMTNAPIFIVGCPRSGTTMLQTVLDAHPNIAIPPETHLFARFEPFAKGYGNLEDPKKIKKLIADILGDQKISLWNPGIENQEFFESLSESSFRGVVETFFRLYARKQGKTRWGDKTPQHAFHLKEILSAFPDAKIIHVIRDGRDVAESTARVYIGPKSIYRIAWRWRKYIEAFLAAKTFFPEEQFLEVRYEKLVTNLPEELKRIWDYLGEKDVPEIRDIPETKLRRLYQKKLLHESVGKKIFQHKIGIYRDRLSLRDVEIFEGISGTYLRKYDYPLHTNAGRSVSLFEKVYFLYQDFIYRYLRKLENPKVIWWDLSHSIQLLCRRLLRSSKPSNKARGVQEGEEKNEV